MKKKSYPDFFATVAQQESMSVRRYEKLCKEIQAFAAKFYGLEVSSEQIIDNSADKSKLKRIAICYIIKEKVPKKNKAKRRNILQAASISQIVERILC